MADDGAVRRVRAAAFGEQEAAVLLDRLDDAERGQLAGALLAACGDAAPALIARLELDSADPSLMSRRDPPLGRWRAGALRGSLRSLAWRLRYQPPRRGPDGGVSR